MWVIAGMSETAAGRIVRGCMMGLERDFVEPNPVKEFLACHPEVRPDLIRGTSKDARHRKAALADLRNVNLPISGKPEIGAVALRGPLRGHLRVTVIERCEWYLRKTCKKTPRQAGAFHSCRRPVL